MLVGNPLLTELSSGRSAAFVKISCEAYSWCMIGGTVCKTKLSPSYFDLDDLKVLLWYQEPNFFNYKETLLCRFRYAIVLKVDMKHICEDDYLHCIKIICTQMQVLCHIWYMHYHLIMIASGNWVWVHHSKCFSCLKSYLLVLNCHITSILDLNF